MAIVACKRSGRLVTVEYCNCTGSIRKPWWYSDNEFSLLASVVVLGLAGKRHSQLTKLPTSIPVGSVG